MIKKILILILVVIGRKSIAQDAAFISIKNEIVSQLQYQKMYTISEGVPTQWYNGNEVHGYLTIERHIFFKDSVFEEFVFIDQNEGIPTAPNVILTNSTTGEQIIRLEDSLCYSDTQRRVLVYKGVWRIKADTICLDLTQKSYYLESDTFSECFYQYHSLFHPNNLFYCETSTLLCNLGINERRRFTLQNNELIEISGNGYRYK